VTARESTLTSDPLPARAIRIRDRIDRRSGTSPHAVSRPCRIGPRHLRSASIVYETRRHAGPPPAEIGLELGRRGGWACIGRAPAGIESRLM
jgi:hypothetical protein